MSLIWSDDNVNVYDIVSADVVDQILIIRGTGTINGRFFEWSASVTPNGWYITFPGKGSSQGATFNLQLEVATAANRLL